MHCFALRVIECLRILCATKFATSYYVLERLLEVCTALLETVLDQHFDAWLSKYKGFAIIGVKCVQLVTSTLFWAKCQKIVDIVKPFVDLLRIVDTDKFIRGKVYWMMSQAINKVKDNDKLTTKEHKDIAFCATNRWTMMHAQCSF